ncbi:MAG: tetratricopeptide repeat protein, partial [Planctomycetes bacterium]|nr:tetratricopeptide repeat protein [Planctomycetota bacterium]
MEIPSAELAPIRELYARGLYLQALRKAETFGPFTEWSNSAARLMGGRLVIQLGAPRLGRWLHLRAYRDTPTYHEAIYYHARYRLEKFGPLAAWHFLRNNPEWNEAPPDVRADWYALHGFVSARLRDFDRSERWLNRAESQSHDRAWLCIERASALEFAERYDDALASARRSMELSPWFRPGVQAEAHLLQMMGKEREAIERLTEAIEHIESGIVVAHLAGMQFDLGRYHDARRSYERYAELSPLMEEEVLKWLAARRCDTAYFTNDRAAAKAEAPKADEEFYTTFNKTLEETTDEGLSPIVRLDISAPEGVSTTALRPLDLIARFWKTTTSVVPDESVIYDGLPDFRERRWAEENGFRAIEFTLTPETAFTLLERGTPFLLTLVDAGFTHSQVVIGCDRLRNSLWLRDPQDRRTHEAPLKPLFERYSTFGPRGLALAPLGKTGLHDGIVLLETHLYDHLHRIQLALSNFDRDKAQSILEEMNDADAEHRLTRFARIAIARYDSNPTRLLQALDAMLALYPDEPTFLLARINVLRDLGRKEDRFDMAREQIERMEGDPLFAQHFAQIVMPDPRYHAQAIRVMRRAIRKRPYAAVAYYFLANLLWEQRQFHEAADLYRFAASLDERDEQFAEGYFRAAHVLEQTPEAMRFLQTRYNRLKGKAAAPARALFYALSEQDEMQSAFDILDQAAQVSNSATAKDPDKNAEVGEVMLFAAEMRTNYNEPEKGLEILESARPLAAKSSWLRAASRMAMLQSELTIARQHWEEVLKEDPLAVDAHRQLTRTIADLEGREAAIAWLRGWSDRHPTFHPLQQLLIDWLRGDSATGGDTRESPAEPVIRRLIAQCPEDAWAHRELALHLANVGRGEEALNELEISRRLEPDSPSYFFTLGHVQSKSDRPSDAREAYEEAIRQSVDNEVAIAELVALAGEEDKEETLQFVADELKSQPNFGDGLLTFRDQAVNIIEPDDLLRILQALLDDHVELWQCWSTTIQQLLICSRLEEAHELAKEAVTRFPLLARVWVDLAEVRRAQNEIEGQIEALRQAVTVAPGWSFAARELAETLEANQQSEDARVVLEQAVARSPLDPVNHGYLADNLWNANESEEAIERLRIALKLDPGYDWAWRALGDWSERMELAAQGLEVAREVARLRPGDYRSWLALVRMLMGREHNEEALQALDRAIALNPRSIEAYDLKAERLADMGRFDEAKAAALPEVFEADPPNLEAAEKLVELRPDSPVALAMRGEAKLQTGDRDGGKADLREAQKIAPGYSFAGMLLFDAYLQDEEFNNARNSLALLQEHIGGSGRPFVAARYSQLAAHEDEMEAALDALRDAFSLHCDSTWPINTAVAECRKAGWSEEADKVLQSVILEAEEFHPYTLFAWLEGPDGSEADIERKLKLINRCIAAHPSYIQTYDVKAELLARNNRYDEAIDTCHPPTFGDTPPMILRGRSAWVQALRGDRETAIARMREILVADPDYYWGWQQIANWFDAEEAHSDYLEAAENLVRLAPSDPAAYGYRGEAKLFGGDRRGAKADFQRAFELDPNYAFAGLHLMDELLADEELEAANNTLARLQEHIGGPYVRLRAVRLAIKNRDEESGGTQFREMCRDEEAPYMLLGKAADAMTEAGWGTTVENSLNDAIEDETSVSHIGRLWAERVGSRNVDAMESRLPSLLERGEIGAEALMAAVSQLAKPATAAKLHECIARYDKQLRSTNRAWAKAAEALIDVGDFKVAATWVADWETRDPDEPWMLLPAAVA